MAEMVLGSLVSSYLRKKSSEELMHFCAESVQWKTLSLPWHWKMLMKLHFRSLSKLASPHKQSQCL